jgi:hypothetical protein
MEISSSTHPVSHPAPPKVQPPQNNRSREYAAQQQKAAAHPQHAEHPKPQPVVNTQGQSTGHIVNTKA